MKKSLIVFILLTVCLVQITAGTGELEFALFKRTVSPVMKWGENGILTVPKATTVGRTNAYVGLFGQQAGSIFFEGKLLDLYLTSATIMAGSSADVELGYTRRQLIWEDFYFTDMTMDTFHLKTRILDFGANLLPEIAVGMNGVSLVDNTFTNKKDILFNPYLVATSNLSLIPDFLELSVTVLAETIMSEGEFGLPQFSIGADVKLLNFLYAFSEVQGIQVNLDEIDELNDLASTNNEMVNIGVKLKLGWFSAGVGMFNIIRETAEDTGDLTENVTSSTFNLDSAKYMGSVVFEIPLGNMSSKEM